MKDCRNCTFRGLCQPFLSLADKLAEIRVITIDAWLASDKAVGDCSSIYNSFEQEDDEKKFESLSSEAILHLADGCQLHKKERIK